MGNTDSLIQQQSNGDKKNTNQVQEPMDEADWNEMMVNGTVYQPNAPKGLNDELQTLLNHKAKFKMNKDGSVTFYPTPNCKPSKTPLKTNKPHKVDMNQVLQRSDCTKLEASSDINMNVVQKSKICSFIDASIDAWANHYPIRFKPEHIWLLILQGVATHVDKNTEKLRGQYVNHKGKKDLIVRRDGFVLGSDKNDWEGVIEEFVEQIDANTVKDTVPLLDCDFSRSTMMDKICAKVTIMDICKGYFSYSVFTFCGFPEITLDGTKQDWVQLKEKTKVLLKTKVDEQFGAEWAKALLPLLDRFIGAFDGEIDCLFWNSMIKRGAVYGSGGYDWFTGWFNILFPFDVSKNPNPFCEAYASNEQYVKQGLTLTTSNGRGLDSHNYPSGLAQAPVTWNYHGAELKLKFIAGFVGYQQNPETLEICPNLGWCIGHENNEKK